MKKLLPLLFTFHLLLFTSCGGATPEEMASLAAKGYYEHLMRGEYRQFLEGKEFQPLDTIGTIDREGYQCLPGALFRRFCQRGDCCPHGGAPRPLEDEVRNVECGMRNVECGMWNEECGMWSEKLRNRLGLHI